MVSIDEIEQAIELYAEREGRRLYEGEAGKLAQDLVAIFSKYSKKSVIEDGALDRDTESRKILNRLYFEIPILYLEKVDGERKNYWSIDEGKISCILPKNKRPSKKKELYAVPAPEEVPKVKARKTNANFVSSSAAKARKDRIMEKVNNHKVNSHKEVPAPVVANESEVAPVKEVSVPMERNEVVSVTAGNLQDEIDRLEEEVRKLDGSVDEEASP